jgi:hypothetical protein
MELIPKFMVVGLFVPPPGTPGVPALTTDKLNRIWSEVAGTYGYTQLQMAPNGAAAQFLGATADEGVAIQPPLIQVRDLITMTTEQSAEKAEAVLKTISRVTGTSQFFNLGVKLVFNAPVGNNDARGFVVNKLLMNGEKLEELGQGGTEWGGVKYVVTHPAGVYTVAIEPLQSDEMKSLFIDFDAQFPGPLASLDAVSDRVAEARDYVTGTLNRFLDSL